MKSVYLRWFTLLIFASSFTAFGQGTANSNAPSINSDHNLPVWDSLRLFVKLIPQCTLDLTYAEESGFTDAAAASLLKKIVKRTSIQRITKTFTKVKSTLLMGIYTIELSNPQLLNALLLELSALPEIDYAERLPIYYSQYIPNDFATPQQPASFRINLDLAWNITTGDPGKRIAIVDDAVLTTHEDLTANCWTNPLEVSGNGIDDDLNGYIDDVTGFDVADQDADPKPPSTTTNNYFTHGTHVAGIATASGDNGLGLAGVAYQCSYIPVKIKKDASTSPGLPDAYLGLEYAIAIHADVINMSWGGFGYSQTYQLLCTAAYDTGIVLVASAGNTGTADSIFPSCYDHVISAGSTNLNDAASIFSTYGTCLDVMAPGTNIYSTLAGNNQSYGAMSGTSMSAPIVSGICALMLANNTASTPDEVEQCLESSCANINLMNQSLVGQLGSGRVDAYGALTCVEAPPHPILSGGACCYSVCTGHSLTFNGASMGLNATSWYWEFPGGTPSTSTSQNPTITYNIPGVFDVIVVACNAFGCDTVIFNDKVCVGLPNANLSALNTGTVCLGSAAWLMVSLFGRPPFSFSVTDGINTQTYQGIMSSPYYIPVFPTTNTPYMLTQMADEQCSGTTSGTVMLYPVDCGPCSNTDFEFGNFSTWMGKLGHCCGANDFAQGITSDRMSITSGSGNDPYTNGQIPMVSPFGGAHSLKLGNYFVGGEAERLEKSFLVTPDNASLTYEFAVVLEDPIGHAHIKKPKFEIRLMDAQGNLLPDTCAYYQVTAGPETDDWIHNGTVRYQGWTQVTVDLTAYINQEITLQFTTEDCGLLGHFGYAYLDARCAAQMIEVMNFCDTGDTITLEAPGGYISYMWTPSGDSTQSIIIPTPQDGDTISVSMRNIAGCVSNITHILHLMPAPQPSISHDTTICMQDTVMLCVNGAGLDGSYLWQSIPAGFTSTHDTIYVTPWVTTQYIASMQNANGCPSDSIVSVIVTVDSTMAFTLLGDQEICLFDTAVLYSTANNDSIQWTSWPPGFSSIEDTIMVSPGTVTTYILDSYGSTCSFRDSTTVTVYDYYYDNPITHLPICTGDTWVYLEAPPLAVNPFWIETGDSTAGITVMNPIPNAIFSVAFVSPTGCNDTLRFIIDLTPDPDANAGPDTLLCEGFSILLHAQGAATPNGTYEWSSIPAGFVANSQDIVVSPTTDTYYIVTVTNGPGCLAPASFDTILVEIRPSPEFELGPDIDICQGDSIFMSFIIPDGFNYWQSNPPGFQSMESDIWLKPDTTTTYYLTINTSICTFSDEFTINVFSYNGPNDTATFKFCMGDTSLTLIAPDGYPFYYWPHSGETNDTVQYHGLLTDTTLWVLMRDSTQPCSDSCQIYINEFQASYFPDITALDTTICKGDTIALETAYNSSVQYLWTSQPSGLIDSSGNMVQVVPNDTTTYYCTTTENNCPMHDTLKIYWVPKPYTELPPDRVICFGDTVNLSIIDSLYHYNWSSQPTGFSSADTMISIIPEETTTYTLEISTEYCHSIDSIKIEVMLGMALPDTLMFYYCPTDTLISIIGPANYDFYYWIGLPDTAETITYNCLLGDTSIMVLLGDSISPCFDSCFIKITPRDFNYASVITASDTVLCEGEMLQLSVPPNANLLFTWTSNPPIFSDSSSNIITCEPTESAIFYCEASQWSCSSMDSVTIIVYPIPEFVFPERISLCPGDVVVMDPLVAAINFTWSDGDTTIPRVIGQAGDFELTAANGPCTFVQSSTIDIISDSSLITPNVFTPNGDLYNDFFEVIAENSEVFYIKIYNRWGKLLFESSDPLIQWDGTIGNMQADAGVYFYFCRYKSSCNDKTIEKEGLFHLLR